MQNKWSSFLDQNYDVPEVQFALKSVKILTGTKKRFLKHLSFELNLQNIEKLFPLII